MSRKSLLLILLLIAINYCHVFSQAEHEEQTPVTNLAIELDIYEIKIKDIREPIFDTEGEFYFKRRISGIETRLPSQGHIRRKKNGFIRPSDNGLVDELFWRYSWEENGSDSRNIEIRGYEEDFGGDDEMGTIRLNLDLSNYEFLHQFRDVYLETGDYRVFLNISCAPRIMSQSHSDSSAYYENGDVSISWSRAMPALGILGYSYVLDKNCCTNPDEILEGTYTSRTYNNLPAGTWWFHVKVKDKAGFWSDTGHFKIGIEGDIAIGKAKTAPHDFILLQNYPNPFNAGTVIRYQLPKKNHVKIRIYNLTGQYIHTLINEEQMNGVHQVAWNGNDAYGVPLSSGIYVAVIEFEQFRKMLRMTIIR